MNKLWNVLLYPARLYAKLTDNKLTLVAGIILVGLIDFFLPDVNVVNKLYFTDLGGRSAADIQFNILVAVFLILLLGVIDVLFFSIPLHDIFKFFKKKEGLPHHASPIKVMKVYIMSHFIIIPADVILYFSLYKNITDDSNAVLIALTIIAIFTTRIWSSAIITRGINTLFQFGLIVKKLTFLIVFTWSFLFSTALSDQIMNWLLKLLR